MWMKNVFCQSNMMRSYGCCVCAWYIDTDISVPIILGCGVMARWGYPTFPARWATEGATLDRPTWVRAKVRVDGSPQYRHGIYIYVCVYMEYGVHIVAWCVSRCPRPNISIYICMASVVLASDRIMACLCGYAFGMWMRNNACSVSIYAFQKVCVIAWVPGVGKLSIMHDVT